MNTIDISREHNLGDEDCQHALEELSGYLHQQLGAVVDKTPTQLVFKGKGFSGSVTIGPGLVSGHIKLGLLARPFKRQLEAEITRQLDARLDA